MTTNTRLRDALLFTTTGDDPGVARGAFRAYKRLSARKPGFTSKSVAAFADLLELSFDDSLAQVVNRADATLQSCPLRCGRPPSGFFKK